MTDNQTVRKWVFATNEEAVRVLGPNDTLLTRLEQSFAAKVTMRGTEVVFTGEAAEVDLMYAVVSTLTTLAKQGIQLGDADYRYVIQMAKSDDLDSVVDIYTTEIGTTYKGKAIRVKTLGQRHYVNAIGRNDIVFGVGPAGTGKTYLAVAMAVMALKRGEVKRIVLTRPAVEAGEKLGFLPGDLQEKVDPYLRPLYDALHDIYGLEQVQRAMERGNIEIAPLAYMRGRTLDDSYVILDEAQNTTAEQMKMFLTRLGFHSKMVITGDVTQIDLPTGKTSGLVHAHRVLKEVEGIHFHLFSASDVVRHHLVQKIIDAYNRTDEGEPSAIV
ncbi:PhoH family protein [Alicyclobacillus acidoterrestris]|uniref:PhoH-like protein n=1 Tax=Alicyclobacillus acidoterrestris (strain ATCC 49025 / DSM 3922 / CIP 106132 / NCIMB 13137 / GD3B) TaxID=1356854 RepID=T0DSZ6_ALIAG|nr:PhoH family protein [Alicyclobacillus acidoterrestris]EPZ52576.1 phosphate starvation protein PhoH [Alicyclobacillus acidoterrestris ATCC 49025]UNO47898.1 PhoH family protein [Alicyclobacillus acidoterrestris]GEO26832.1 phosphate starvation protein PhoH [Alicyclobacillus acidoterrestris]